MPLLTQYDTPAGLRDTLKPEFYQAWHSTVDGWVLGTDFGGPFPNGGQPNSSAEPSPPPPPAGDSRWLDPLREEHEFVRVRPLSWIGMSREQLAVSCRDNRDEAFRRAETDRDRQPEYFEWHATRCRATGKITKVVFVAEDPAYWALLAAVDRDAVFGLYQQHVSVQVRWSDLFDDQGVYQPANRWNTTDGIMHWIMGANRIQLALMLARGGAANLTPDKYTDAAASAPTAVDDYILMDVGAVVRSGHHVAPRNPVGVYLEGWDDTGFTKPDGTPVGHYWTITRGAPDAVLRLEYAVPEEEGFVVGDISIGGRPIVYGGQIAEHMHAELRVDVVRKLS